ncbi:TPM domain-containing protein [Aliarcobacter butzleri]
MKKIIIFLLLILNFLNADISQYFPKLEGRVIDEANLLSPEVKKDINNILKNEENKSSNQIVVVILNSLNGYSIEEFSYQLGRFWGIGQKDKNNGVLLVVSMKEREIRIEVGYGLEGALTDKISHEIINYTIKPNFKASQYELGILKAVNEIIKATQGEYVAKPKNKEYSSNF